VSPASQRRKELHPQFYSFRWLSLLVWHLLRAWKYYTYHVWLTMPLRCDSNPCHYQMSQELQLPELIRLWDSLLADDRRFEFLGYFCCAMLLYAIDTFEHVAACPADERLPCSRFCHSAALCGKSSWPVSLRTTCSSSRCVLAFAVACVLFRSSPASSTPSASCCTAQNYPIAEIHDVLQLAYQLRQEDRDATA